MKNRDPVSRRPWLYNEPPASSLLAAPTASERERGDLAPRSVWGFFLPPPPLFPGRTSLVHSGFSERLPPPPCPASSPRRRPATHARTHCGQAQRLSKPPFISPTAARAAPAPALAQQGCVFFGSQRPPLLSISYGTPPGFKADSSGKAGEMDSVGSEGACPLSFPPASFSPQEIPFSARLSEPPPQSHRPRLHAGTCT